MTGNPEIRHGNWISAQGRDDSLSINYPGIAGLKWEPNLAGHHYHQKMLTNSVQHHPRRHHNPLAGVPTNTALREAKKMLDSFKPRNAEREFWRVTTVRSAAGAFNTHICSQAGDKPAFHV